MTHGVLLIDKPSGVTSHDVVAVARRAFGTRGIGHAGTLDPMATGVLVIAIGEGRKALRYLSVDDKCYEARVRLGVQTDTLDAEGRAEVEAAVPPGLALERVREVARSFVGCLEQRPPAVSALKLDGQPMYKRVRRGERVAPEPREVVVHELDVLALEGNEIALRVRCGKGFYVRALARDLALALGTVGHLAALRRLQSGRFAVDDAVRFADLQAASRGDADARSRLSARVLTMREALHPAPCVRLDAQGAAHAVHGRPIPLGHILEEDRLSLERAAPEPIVLCDERAIPIALARNTPDGLRVVRGLSGASPAASD